MPLPSRISGKKVNGSEAGSAIGSNDTVPNSKKPKTRPPTSLRDKVGFLHGTLPTYSGPYSVGAMDIEVPAEAPRPFSHITRNGRHILQLETVLMSIYYPSGFGSGSGRDPAGRKRWSRETWLPRPRINSARGYGRFASIGDFAVPWFAATTMFTKIPAFRNATIARHWPPLRGRQELGFEVKNSEGPPPPGEAEEPCFPSLIFSHGLGGIRTTYSSICGEFASYGFVVCSVEHRDGSGPRTIVNHTKQGEGSMEEREKKGGVDHTKKEKKSNYDQVDYIFPEGNPRDTDPNNEKGVDRELRNAQIEFRLAEIEEAYNVLCHICRGDGETIAKKNLRRKGYIGSSSRGLDGVDWASWKDRFHTTEVTMLGHSFGAATTVEMLRHVDRFQWVSQGIIYDIWGAAVHPPDQQPNHRINRPLLGINSEAFMYWQSNFDAAQSLVEESSEHNALAWLLTVRGTIHVSQSDFSILYPNICALFLKMTANPKRALDLNINASLEFLKTINSARIPLINRALNSEGLLQTSVLEEMPTDHKPDDKWMGARLKVPHEFTTRVLPRLVRKTKRAAKGQQSDASDEIWMHYAPTKEQLERHGVKYDLQHEDVGGDGKTDEKETSESGSENS